ncbi:MAG: single-stranded-DNA-specific exonuclease RecJ [Lachnospiraceae bacterium]|nr:single-stranded-DNA-specific exonuclease RecJ [Lachnospiraceae bacterium]
MQKWFLQAKRADFNGIGAKFHIDPVLARIIRNRDIIEEKDIENYLYGTKEGLFSPKLLKDMDKAVKMVTEGIKQQKRIRIISDYDVDGVISNYVLLKGLKRLGAQVDYQIPDRMKDGYGLNKNIIKKAKEDGIDMILTCDNGIAATEEIKYGKELGLTIVVTDHHDVLFEETEEGKNYILPEADAIVNPKQADCTYPTKTLCGAAVAYKLMEALYSQFQIEAKELHELLEYVAIATVCDVVDLLGENRIIVKEGLKRLQSTKNLGLQKLILANHLENKKLTSYHLGFVIGPCLNACGRLESAELGLKLLLEEDEKEAEQLAQEITSLNAERKDMTKKGVEQAIRFLETKGEKEHTVLVVYLPECHESLAGIIAGRLREYYYKPVFVITKAKEGLKGSGRSIEGYHMFEELCECKELLEKFGGHPMAAGLSLKEENLQPFIEKINRVSTLTEEDLTEKVLIDVPMPIDYITEDLIESMSLLEPFGKANPKPVFAEKGLKLLFARILGEQKNVLKLQVENAARVKMEAMFFGDIEAWESYIKEKYGENVLQGLYEGKNTNVELDVTYYPDINEYNGQRKIQIIIQNYR